MPGEPAAAVRNAPGPAAPPGSPAGLAAVDREFQALRARLAGAGAPYLDPDDWAAGASRHEGSWWPAWEAWLAQHSSGREQPPAMGAPGCGYPPLEDAPGTYVLQR
jgi:hypothetical protein